MKSKTLLSVLFGLLCVTGCQNKDDISVSETPYESGSLYSEVLSQEEAEAAAVKFLDGLNGSTRSASTQVENVCVWHYNDKPSMNRSASLSASISDTLMYIVNLKDKQGFVIVSAVKSKSGVLAYVEEGNMDPSDEIDNPGFELFVNSACQYLSQPQRLSPMEPHYFPPLILLKNKLLITKWKQRSPFNDDCPLINGIHALAGCGPIATAQVVAYYKTPSSYNGTTYNWDSIYVDNQPTTQVGREGVAHFVHSIGILENANYGLTGTSVTTSSIGDCLDYLGLSYSFDSYLYSRVRGSVLNDKPVIIIGSSADNTSAHAWVLDGIYEYTETIIETLGDGTILTIPRETDYVHCNWGWGGECDGYYYSGVFDTQARQFGDNVVGGQNPPVNVYYDFSYNIHIYYDVCPI